MRRPRRILSIAPLALLLGATDAPRDARARLVEAKAKSEAASARASQLEQLSEQEAAVAAKAKAAEAAVAARIRAAQADIIAAEARLAIVTRRLDRQRGALADAQGPLVKLVAALQSLAARPTVVALAQPGSVDDLVHVRAVLGTAFPAIEARSAGARAALAQARKLERDAVLATKALTDGRARLQAQRLAFVRLEAEHRLKANALGRDALIESDRAIALGERARELAGTLETGLGDAQTGANLARLPGPLPRPRQAGDPEPGDLVTADGRPPYRLPVAGRLIMGLGETALSGVRSRGVTLLPSRGERVVAPAAGRVVFAGPFRDYGEVVIIDHGGGWTSAVTGLGKRSVAVGARVAAGGVIGRARTGDDPAVTVELRRRGRPVELTQLIG